MKNIFKKYYHATPKRWRQIGDCLLATGLFALGMESIRIHPDISLSITMVCIIGKFLTNMPSELDK